MPISSVLPVISLVGAPALERPKQRAPVAVDEAAHLRAFHLDAFVARGGELSLDLAPVESRGGGHFLVSSSVPDPGVPMGLGAGWLMVRDPSGGAAVVMVDEEMTLAGLIRLLRQEGDLDAAVVLAQDDGGFRMVVVFDQAGQAAFASPDVGYRPAVSVATSARVGFGEWMAFVSPEGSFTALDGHAWPVDRGAVYSARDFGPLHLTAEGHALLLAADLQADASGWEPFDEVAEAKFVNGGWQFTSGAVDEALREAMSYDLGHGWRQQEARFVTVAGPDKMVGETGSLDMFIETSGVDPADYGLTTPSN